MQKSYKCPQCGKDVIYITNPCPNCKLRLDWTHQPPIPYLQLSGEQQQKIVQQNLEAPQQQHPISVAANSLSNNTAGLWQGDDIDYGQKVLKFIFESMMIDDGWSIKEERSFKWWGHQLAQSVWAEPPRQEHGGLISLVHVETDFLRNVPETEKTYELLNTIQGISSLYAFVYYSSEKKIKLHSTAYFHEGNYGWLSGLLIGAAGLQLADAYRYPQLLQVFEGSDWDITPHPINGYRETPDELIGDIGKACASVGKTPVKVPEKELKEICKILSKFNVLAISDKGGLTAEFHFVGDEPAMQRMMDSKKGVATSLFQTGVDMSHPQLGHGICSNLRLPLSDTQERGYRRCNQMNLLESSQWTTCHLLGAWQASPEANNKVTVNFSSFLPAISYQSGILANLAISNGVRSKWASTTLNTIADAISYEAEEHLDKADTDSLQVTREEVISDVTKAIDMNTKSALDYVSHGDAYQSKAEYDKAIADYTRAIELDPNFSQAYSKRGNAYCSKGDYNNAIADYTRVIELSPDHFLSYLNRGSVYSDKGEYDNAIADYTKAIALVPKYPLAYFYRGWGYADKGEYDKAIADYTTAIELDPKYAAAYFNRGFAYHKKGEEEKATVDHNKAKELGYK